MKFYLKIISDLLAEKKIEKQDFAKLIEKTPQTVSNYFSERSVIDIETFLKIASVLDTPISNFFEKTEKNFVEVIKTTYKNSHNSNINSHNSNVNFNDNSNPDIEKLLTRIESLERENELLKENHKTKDKLIELLNNQNNKSL